MTLDISSVNSTTKWLVAIGWLTAQSIVPWSHVVWCCPGQCWYIRRQAGYCTRTDGLAHVLRHFFLKTTFFLQMRNPGWFFQHLNLWRKFRFGKQGYGSKFQVCLDDLNRHGPKSVVFPWKPRFFTWKTAGLEDDPGPFWNGPLLGDMLVFLGRI